MQVLQLLQDNPAFFMLTVGIFSLLVGSFLNAAIYRIPVMMHRDWDSECDAHYHRNDPDYTPKEQEHFSLWAPRSACTQCGHTLSALENIPVISYLFLRGKCKSCKTPISIQYPIIELVTALLSIFIAWKYGYSWQTLLLLIFLWGMIALAIIDAKTMLLPDVITLPLMWLGIFANSFGVFTDLHSSVIGAIAGYLSLWSVYQLFKLVTGKEGMGYGDFKILAAIGAWGGWQVLPFTIFASALVGAVIGSIMLKLQNKENSQPVPYGPWLALAGTIAVLWRDEIAVLMRNHFLM